MKKTTILAKKQKKLLQQEQPPSKEEEKTLLLQEKQEKKRKDQERRRKKRKKRLSQKREKVENTEEITSRSEGAEESSSVENDLPIDEPPEKPTGETKSTFVMRPHSRQFLREKDEQMHPHKGLMATVQEKYKDRFANLPADFESRRLLLRQWRGLDG